MKLLAGSSNQDFAHKLAQQLNIQEVACEFTQFPNGELRPRILDSVKGENIILLQSFSEPVHKHIVEFLLLADALERAGARHVNAVIPWLGYSMQDKMFREGEPIAAKVVANLVSNSYVKRAFLFDLHNSSIPGFFSVPTHHLSALEILAEHLKSQNLTDKSQVVIASPDFGGLKRARVFANLVNLDLIHLDKHRDLATGEVKTLGVTQPVDGKTIVIFDDIINGGGTVVESAKFLKEHGAAKVIFIATHGIFANNGREKIANSPVDQVVVSNTIAQPDHAEKIHVLDVSKAFADQLQTWM